MTEVAADAPKRTRDLRIPKETLFSAINRRQPLLVRCSDGHARVVEPHAFGRNSQFVHFLVAFQTRGPAGEGAGWKVMCCADIEELKLLPGHFKLRTGYEHNPDVLDGVIYCQIDDSSLR